MTLLYKALAAVAVIAALFFAVNWYNSHQQAIGVQEEAGRQAARDRDALRDALDETARLAKIVKGANDEAEKRNAENRRLASANRALSVELRDARSEIDARLSSASCEAVRDAARAYGELFGDVESAGREMAEAAAGHLSDVKKLEAAWPQ